MGHFIFPGVKSSIFAKKLDSFVNSIELIFYPTPGYERIETDRLLSYKLPDVFNIFQSNFNLAGNSDLMYNTASGNITLN